MYVILLIACPALAGSYQFVSLVLMLSHVMHIPAHGVTSVQYSKSCQTSNFAGALFLIPLDSLASRTRFCMCSAPIKLCLLGKR